MGTNYRGGPPGFIRVVTNDASGVTLAYPEYSGNRLYHTLGNLQTTPRAGFVFPDFETGDVLYITADTKILVGKEAAAILPRSNLAVMIYVVAARFVQRGLPFRGEAGEPSPYNPPIRYLALERTITESTNRSTTATLIKKDILTPSIARFRFSINRPAVRTDRWKPGQHIALTFADDLSLGYSHMRDSDPQSLNDDYTRSFTISSQPGDLPREQFEVTIRNVGVVTEFMLRQNERAGLEVGVLGVGGDFVIEQPLGNDVGEKRKTAFIAGGIGITPLLGQMGSLDFTRLHIFWMVNIRDLGLAVDAFERHPRLASSTTSLFISGGGVASDNTREGNSSLLLLEKVEASGARVQMKRLGGSDLLDWEEEEDDDDKGERMKRKWYVCAGTSLRKSVLEWLGGREVLYEDFGY